MRKVALVFWQKARSQQILAGKAARRGIVEAARLCECEEL
jgi:hypothetical protein